ncbi:MAG: glycosyltransferase family 2 protein [Sedimentisphaerales bacterium]|nr:glycosyltransferase family 2 protein [Sedimentisphaerales bacterium]
MVIPYYKSKEQIDKCITHLKNQTIEIEIFVRDNSIDNVYFTAAVNEGIRMYLSRSCEYILILNQDMYLGPDAVEKMVTFMDSHPDCGICAPLHIDSQIPESVIFAGGREVFPCGIHLQGRLSDFDRDEKILWANGACMMLRKKMIWEVGLLDENFVFIGSDSDYCFTARSRGWQIWRVASARGVHEQGSSARLSEMSVEILKIKDMIYFGKKWLTGDLYKQLAYEGDQIHPAEIGRIMSELRESESELEKLSGCSLLNQHRL